MCIYGRPGCSLLVAVVVLLAGALLPGQGSAWSRRVQIAVYGDQLPALKFAYANTTPHAFRNGAKASEFREGTYTCWHPEGWKAIEVQYNKGVVVRAYDALGEVRLSVRSSGLGVGRHANGRKAWHIASGKVLFWREDGTLAVDATLAQAVWRAWETDVEVDQWMVFHEVQYGEFAPRMFRRLKRGVGHVDPWVRAEACAGLATFGRDALPATSALRKALGDDFWWVRNRAAEALRQIGPEARRGAPEFAAVLKRLGAGADEPVAGKAEPTLRIKRIAPSALLAFCMLDSEPSEISDLLIDVAGTTHTPTRTAFAEYLKEIGPHAKAAIPGLVYLLNSRSALDVNVGIAARKWAASALTRIGPSAIPALAEALNDRYTQRPVHAIEALAQIGEAAIPALTEACWNVDPDIQRRAVLALAGLGAAARSALPTLRQALGGMKPSQRRPLIAAFAKIAGPGSAVPVFDAAVGQVKASASPTISLQIHCENPGKRRPRLPKAEPGSADSKLFYRVERQIRWELDGKPVGELSVLRKALAAIFADRRRWVADPEKKGRRKAPVLVIEPLDEVCWQEVIQVFDLAMKVGVTDLRMGPTHRFRWVNLKSVVVPGVHDLSHVMPRADYCEPDDRPVAGRPVIDLMQDGRVVSENGTIYLPARDKEDFSGVLADLLKLRAEARKEGRVAPLVGQGIQGDGVTVPILIRADKWTEWSLVQRMIELCGDPRVLFWKLEFGVADDDLEKRHLKRRGR